MTPDDPGFRERDAESSGGQVLTHLLPVGIGIAIGLAGVPLWGLWVVLAAIAISGGHILVRSTHYKAYQAPRGNRGSNAGYLLQSAAWETVKIGIAAFLAMFVRGMLQTP